jgi:hypothetical protein
MMQNNLAVTTNFHHVTHTEVKQDQHKPDVYNVPDLAISLTPISFVFSWVVFLLTLRYIRTRLDDKMVFTINNLHKVPCKNCRFFSNNHYLKCAVQPSIVLTEEAIDCCEYSPKKGSFPPRNLFR